MRTSFTRAPQILVVACYRDADEADRVVRCLSRQSYRETHLVFVRRHEKDDSHLPGSSLEICAPGEFLSHLEKSGADQVLFWPDEGELKETALEKLVLALQLAPDQDGLADAKRGSTGLWLVRNEKATASLIALWIESPTRWAEEGQKRKANLFFIAEHLIEAPEPAELRRPHAVEHLFGKLPFKFENYQPIATGPLWLLPADDLDERSILFLVTSLPMGGACKFILDIAGQLKSRGYRVTVATTTYDTQNPNPWLDKLLQITPDVFVLSHSRPVELPRQIVHLVRAHRCGRVAISHSLPGYQLLPWLRSELPDVTFLDYTHIEYETEWPKGGYALRSVNNQSLLDMSMVSSEHLRQWMIDHGAEADGLRICHTNIDAEKWAPSAEARARDRYELGIDAKTAMILYPCRLAEQKRPELMCNIVAALRGSTKVPFVVVVAGDGPLLPALKKFIGRHELEDSFRLLGAVTLDHVARLHNASDIFFLPSLIEGIALALFEAMALESVPVVADVGGQRELLTPDCGHLIPPGEPEHELPRYVAALKHLLENPEVRRQKAKACRQRVVKYFQIGNMTEKFISAMREADLRHHARPVRLPEAAVCRELATLAIDQIRLAREGSILQEMGDLIHDKATKLEKTIVKLRRQLESAHSIKLVPEENEIRC
jgi:glycosyltransferase involved in cell wall biosynthesis